MIDNRLQEYANMWTVDLSRYALIELDPERSAVCVVKDLVTGGLVVIDDDGILQDVIMNMRKAGARIMTPEEARPK